MKKEKNNNVVEIWGEQFNDKKQKFTRKKFKLSRDDKPIILKKDEGEYIKILNKELKNIPLVYPSIE